eukprot:c24865_g2_i1 orf=448-2577(+)
MSTSDSIDKAPTNENEESQHTNLSPEAMSLSYEELFDTKQDDDGPCYLPSYLPEKAEDDSETSINEDTNVEEDDVTSEEGASEVQTLFGNEDDCVTSGVFGGSGSSELPSFSGGNGSRCISDNLKGLNLADGVSAEQREDFDSKANTESLSKNNLEEGHVDSSQQKDAGAERNLPDATFTDSGHLSGSEIQLEAAAENGHHSADVEESSVVDGVSASSAETELIEKFGGTESILPELRPAGQDEDPWKRDPIPGKQYQNEDDSSAAWRKHKKHFFILSLAGKPIYSRYGDEHKLAGFSATLQAIMSFVESSGDSIKYVRAGDHQVVFLVKGPIYLVSISATDEPLRAIKGQLELLHGQLLLILTKSLEKCYVKNANFDLRPLLGGTETVFSSLIHSFSWNPASFLSSYTCLPLSHTARQAAGAALQDVADADLLFALLLSDSKVISLVGAQKASLHPDDILLLSNFVSSSESFRTTESFSPVCLPKYNAAAFLYAYVRYLDTDTCLILITKNSDAFFHLKECRARVESFLMETHVLRDISNSVAKGGLLVEDLPGDVLYGSLARSKRSGNSVDNKTSDTTASATKQRPGVGGAAGLWHFIYRSIYLDQYVASEFSPPLHTSQSQKRLFRAYQRLYASMHGAPAGSHQMQYSRDENHVLLAWSTADFEFFAAFDPLAEKSSAITVCNRVCQWIRDVENDFFFVGASPFNW